MLESFTAGWLPRGWRRGDSIRVINEKFHDGYKSALVNIDTTRLPVDPCEDRAIIEFHETQRGQVLKWLRWFCSSDDYVDMARRI